MTPFKFPLPPPPPPKASSSSSQQPYATQRGDHARGRGNGGRGRGGGGGPGRGGYGQGSGRGDERGRVVARGLSQYNTGGGFQRGGLNAGYGQQQQYQQSPSQMPSLPIAIPSTAYTNPLFGNPLQDGGYRQAPVINNALASAMSFIATPAGQQSMAAFADHMATVGIAATPYPQSPPSQPIQQATRFSPPQHAGQKRKHIAQAQAQPQSQRHPPQQGLKPPRAKAAVAPPIPSFGFSLPPPPVVRPAIAGNTRREEKHQKKRKPNLGLTHHTISEESSEDEDIDEEVAYAAKLKGGGFVFEHGGEQIAIRTAAEVAAWIKDRRRNFPTQRRIYEKAEQAATQRISELDFLRKLERKPSLAQSVPRQEPLAKTHEGKKVDKRKQDADRRRQEELAALRKKLHKSMLKRQAAPTTVDLGLGYDSATDSDDESSILSDSSVVTSGEDSSVAESSSSSESDSAPIATSSKIAPAPIRLPPPLRAPQPPKTTENGICPDWQRTGRCRYSHKCRFEHPRKEDSKPMGLYERLVEQELAKADQRALDAIKFLGQHGFLNHVE